MNNHFTSKGRQSLVPLSECGDYDYAVSSCAAQRPVTLQLDVSGSMSTGGAIDQVNRGTQKFAVDLRKDPLTRDTVQVQVIAFGGKLHVTPFSPVVRFSPPTFTADGGTPLAEALLAGIMATYRHVELLRGAAQVDVLKPHYFLFSDGVPTSPAHVLREACDAVRQEEQAGRGAFYAFGVTEAAVKALQPLFVRPVFLLEDQDFARFFHIVSVSVRHVSSRSVSEDEDLSPMINSFLRIPRDKDSHA